MWNPLSRLPMPSNALAYTQTPQVPAVMPNPVPVPGTMPGDTRQRHGPRPDLPDQLKQDRRFDPQQIANPLAMPSWWGDLQFRGDPLEGNRGQLIWDRLQGRNYSLAQQIAGMQTMPTMTQMQALMPNFGNALSNFSFG